MKFAIKEIIITVSFITVSSMWFMVGYNWKKATLQQQINGLQDWAELDRVEWAQINRDTQDLGTSAANEIRAKIGRNLPANRKS